MTSPKDWREELQFGIMEAYLLDAELTHAAKDPKEHMERMRAHWTKLLAFIESIEREARAEGYKEASLNPKIMEAVAKDVFDRRNNEVIRQALRELRGEIKAYPLEELMPFTKKDIIYLLDTKIKEL